jgi:N utilization substance protein B
MPAIDRNLLRIAVFEIGNQADIPSAVAISEAVALAKELSTAESPNFINGVLGALVKQ